MTRQGADAKAVKARRVEQRRVLGKRRRSRLFDAHRGRYARFQRFPCTLADVLTLLRGNQGTQRAPSAPHRRFLCAEPEICSEQDLRVLFRRLRSGCLAVLAVESGRSPNGLRALQQKNRIVRRYPWQLAATLRRCWPERRAAPTWHGGLG